MKQVFLMSVLALILTGCSDNSTPKNATKAESNTAVEKKATEVVPADSKTTATAEMPMAVKATDLFKAYSDNEVAADQKYKDKLLLVSGTINSIESGIANQATVNLKTSNEFMNVMASGDDAFTKAAVGLKKGAKINLQCHGDGEVAGSPMLSDCVIK